MIGIVVNPSSGEGKGLAFSDQASRILSEQGKESKTYFSSAPGEIKTKTREAITDGADTIILVGGDGSLNEAVGEIASTGIELLLLPCGTGNDFARALRLPKDPIEAFRKQLSGKKKLIDCGKVNERFFVNVSGSGFDVDVLKRFEELKQTMPGPKAYRKAVIDVISNYKPFSPKILIDGKPVPDNQYAVAEIANGQYFGGGMKVAPDASVDDGLFDVVLVRAVPRILIPFLLPLFIWGLHVRIPLAKVLRAHSVEMRCDGMTVNIDGQLERMDSARYEVVPNSLFMRLPE